MPRAVAFGARRIGAGVSAVVQRVSVRSSDRRPGSFGWARLAAWAVVAVAPGAIAAIRNMSARQVGRARSADAEGIHPVVRPRRRLLEGGAAERAVRPGPAKCG